MGISDRRIVIECVYTVILLPHATFGVQHHKLRAVVWFKQKAP